MNGFWAKWLATTHTHWQMKTYMQKTLKLAVRTKCDSKCVSSFKSLSLSKRLISVYSFFMTMNSKGNINAMCQFRVTQKSILSKWIDKKFLTINQTLTFCLQQCIYDVKLTISIIKLSDLILLWNMRGLPLMQIFQVGKSQCCDCSDIALMLH